jgi:hypothetical protein
LKMISATLRLHDLRYVRGPQHRAGLQHAGTEVSHGPRFHPHDQRHLRPLV